MVETTGAGSVIAIGTKAATLSSDTYTDIGTAMNHGAIGRVFNTITYNLLKKRDTQYAKGNAAVAAVTIQVARDASDAGALAAQAAVDDDAAYNFRLTLNDASGETGSEPTKIYFKALVMGFPLDQITPEQIVIHSLTLQPRGETIDIVDAT